MENVGVKKNSFNSKVTPMMAQYLEMLETTWIICCFTEWVIFMNCFSKTLKKPPLF